MNFFEYQKIAHSDVRMEEIFRLRFKVYCQECGYEDACDYQSGLEHDSFDAVSTHFAACESGDGKVVGTVRIIRGSRMGFPALNHFKIDEPCLPKVPSNQIGEISRLAISKEYRRRMVDRAIYSDDRKVVSFFDEKEKRDWRKRFELELVTGLYHCIYEESLRLGLTHLYAVMSDGLYALLKRWGLVWEPIGPLMDYHGVRRPYVASVEENMQWFDSGSSVMISV